MSSRIGSEREDASMVKKLIPISGIFCLIPVFSGCASESASLGVIGGADGPTVILLSSGSCWVYLVPVGILLVGILVFVLWKRRNGKSR